MTIPACSTAARLRTPTIRVLLAVAALTALFALAPKSAAAGTYVMRSCNVPGKPTAPTGPWTWENAGHTLGFNDCARGGGFGVRFGSTQTMQNLEAASLALPRPQSGAKSAILIRQARLWMIARLSGSGAPAFTPLRAYSASNWFQQTETFWPPGGDSLISPVVTPVYDEDTQLLRVMLYCSAGAPEDCSLSNNRPLELQGVEVILEESVLPSVSITGGTLLSGDKQTNVRSVGYRATDQESGIAKSEILLDDRVVAIRNFSADGNRCPHTSWNACGEDVAEEVPVDTRSVPDGTYTVGARTTDAAGNTSIARGGSVTVRNHALPSGSGDPAPAPPPALPTPGAPTGIHLTHVDSAQTLVTSRRIGYGSRATLRAVLRDPAGTPIPHAVVDVYLQTERKGSKLRKVASRTTDAGGRFEYKTGPGPSRLVRFAYGHNSSNSTYTFTHDVKVKTKAGVTLHVSRARLRNGQAVRFYGSIRGIDERKVVEVQVRQHGRWDTIASVRSDPKGRWSWRYRFKRTYEPTRYKFRARVRTEAGFPYATGHSRSRSILVR